MIQMVLGPLKIWAGWCTQGREFTTFDFRRVSPKLMLQIRLTWNNFLGKPVNNLKICKNIMVLYTCVHGKCTWIIYLMLTRINSSNWRYCSQNWGEVPNSTSRKRYWDWTKRGVSTIHLAPTASDRCFALLCSELKGLLLLPRRILGHRISTHLNWWFNEQGKTTSVECVKHSLCSKINACAE